MKSPKQKKPYIISLTLGGVTLKGSGDTVLEALQSLKKPVKIVSKGILKVSHGTLQKEIPLVPLTAKRLFYPMAQPYLAKQLASGLK